MSDIDTAAKFLYMGNQNGPLSKLNGYESGSFNVGKGIPVDPAFGCPKNFVSSYMCGNAVKNINIEGEAVGKRALYDCGDQIDKCKQNQTFATFQNDGNFVLYKGTPENKGDAVWSSGTAGTLTTGDDTNLLHDNNKTTLMTGEKLPKQVKLINENRNGFVQINNDNSINIYKTKIRKGERMGKAFGMGDDGPASFSLYGLDPKNPSENMLKTGYIDINSTLKEYPDSLLEYKNNYTKWPNTNAPGFDIDSRQGISASSCEQLCNINNDCAIYQTDQNNNCWLKSKEAYTEGNITSSSGMTMNIRTRGPISDKYSYTKYAGKDSPGNDIFCSSSNEVSSRGTMQALCDKDETCAAFNWNESLKKGCLKNNNAFSENNTSNPLQSSPDHEYNVKIKSGGTNPFLGSCSKDVVSTSNSRWNQYKQGKDMSADTVCGLSLITAKDRKVIEESEKKLAGIVSKIKGRISRLTSSEKKLNKKVITNYNKMQTELTMFKKEYSKYKKNLKENETLDAMEEDSNIQMISSNNINIVFSVIAIVLVFALIKINKKK